MEQTLLLESLRGEARLAVIEEDRLCELYVERPGSDDDVTGSIYLGRVENVLPGMNAAFVNIGREKNAFLYAGDAPGKSTDSIERRVRPGQNLLVQVSKAQSGQKGHRVTCHLTLPGRSLVLIPGEGSVGVSKKLEDVAERERLHDIARSLVRQSGVGLIVRTAAAGIDAASLATEYEALQLRWAEIAQRAEHVMAPKLLFSGNSLPLRAVRDRLTENCAALWVDGEALYNQVCALAKSMAPEWADRVRLHNGQTPLFDLYRVDVQLEKAMRKYVWLKSGGSLVIEETEAMTVIDVNTGKFTGHTDLEETLFKLNCEAAEEIARQLRLRDIGGIVIVDFIDMSDPARGAALEEMLRELAKRDMNRLTVVGMTGLGLMELTRKKVRRPLSKQLTHTCSTCGGDGVVPSHETTARRCIHEIWRRRRMGESNPILAQLCPPATGWVRSIGAPEGGKVYLLASVELGEGEYRLSPADEAQLPEGCKAVRT